MADGDGSGDELSTCVEALQVLYFGDDMARKTQANAWLEQFQQREAAWTVADRMIRRPDLGTHAQYFAAHTLHTKIMRDFRQLPAAAHSSLEASILQLLQQFREGPTEIRTQLCLALANLIVHMGTWEDPIADVVRMFAGSDGPSALLLIDFLKVLPEEVTNRRTALERERRRMLMGYMRNCAPAFMNLMMSYLNSAAGDVRIIEKIFLCVNSWLRSRVIPLEAFSETAFLTLAFEALNSEQLFDVAVDVLIEAIALSGENLNNRPMIVGILSSLLARRARYLQAVQSEDLDTARGYARLFVEASETYLNFLVEEPAHAKDLLEVLLACLGHPDLDIAQMIFNFCYKAASLIHDTENSQSKDMFLPFFTNVINVILGQLSYPLDSETWTAAKRDEFSDFRHTVGDTLKDCCLVLRSETVLQQIAQRLEAELSRGSQWQTIEAILFSLRSLAREVVYQLEAVRSEQQANEIPTMRHIMGILLSDRLPRHPKIQYTVTLIFGQYAPWSRLHPEYVGSQADYIFSGFSNAEVAPASAVALRHLTQSCGHLISGFVDALLDYQEQTKVLRMEDQLEFTEAIAHVVKSLPENVLQQYWLRFSAPIIAGLQQVLEATPTPTLSEIKSVLTSYIDRLSICFRLSSSRSSKVSPNSSSSQIAAMAQALPQARQSPTVAVIARAWPLMERIFDRFGPVPSVMKSLCRCSRSVMISMGGSFLPYLDSLLTKLTVGYVSYRHSEYLYCALVAVRTFGHIQELNERFAYMITQMAAPTFALLSVNPTEAFTQQADIVQDFFSLLEQCVRVSPTIAMMAKASPNDAQNILPTLLACAIANISFSKTEESITASQLLFENMLYVVYDSEHKAFSAAFMPLLAVHGQSLVSALLSGVANHFTATCVDRVSGMLTVMHKICPEETLQWTANAARALPAVVTPSYHEDLMRVLVNRGDLQPVLRNISYSSHHS